MNMFSKNDCDCKLKFEEMQRNYTKLYMDEMTRLRNGFDIIIERMEKNFENHKNALHLKIFANLEDDFNNRFLLLEERLTRKIDAQRLKDSVNSNHVQL